MRHSAGDIFGNNFSEKYLSKKGSLVQSVRYVHHITMDLENQAMKALSNTKPGYRFVFNLKLASSMLYNLLREEFDKYYIAAAATFSPGCL